MTKPLTENTIKQYCNHIEQEKFGKGEGPFLNGRGRYLCKMTESVCPYLWQICSGAVVGKADLTKCPGNKISQELADEIKTARQEAGVKAGFDDNVRDALEYNNCPNLKRDAEGKITKEYLCNFIGSPCALLFEIKDNTPQFYAALNRCPTYKLSQNIGDKIAAERANIKESLLENKIGAD